MTANPNAPVLPRLATPGSAVTPSNVARKPIPAIVTSPPTNGDAVTRVRASPPLHRVHSPGSGGKTWSPPAKPYATGSIGTMSPVAAARSFNSRAVTRMHPHHVKHHSSASDTIDSPTDATANIYATTKGSDKADRSLADRAVGRETLFDLDDGEMDAADAREIPLGDLVGDELPEYIQVYLKPHPNREGVGAKGVLGGEKGGKTMLGAINEKASKEKEGETEYERRVAKWNDIEATLPAYKSTPSLYCAPASSCEVPEATKGAPKRRRCITAKTSRASRSWMDCKLMFRRLLRR